MILNKELKKKEHQNIIFTDACWIDDSVYFASIYHNGLFSLNLNTHEVNYLGYGTIESRMSFLNMTLDRIGESIFSVPYFGESLIEYNTITQKFIDHHIPIEDYDSNYEKKFFLHIVKYKDDYYMIPCNYPGILKINLSNDCITKYDSWINALSREKKIWFSDFVMQESVIYMVLYRTNKIVSFDLESHEYYVYTIGTKDEELEHIEVYDGFFWLTARDKLKVIQWNKNRNQYNTYDDFPVEARNEILCPLRHPNEDSIFSRIFIRDGKLYMVSSMKPLILVFYINTKKVDIVHLNDITDEAYMEWTNSFYVCLVDTSYCFVIDNNDNLYQYDRKWDLIDKFHLYIPKSYQTVKELFCKFLLSRREVISENELTSLNIDLESFIKYSSYKDNLTNLEKETIGGRIYKSLLFQ